MDEINYSVLQPSDVRRFLNIQTDEEYELVVKSWRFLFDFLFAVKDGTQIVSNLIQFTKCGDLTVLAASSDGRQLELEFNPKIDELVMFDEILGVVNDLGIIKLPTL